MRKSVLGGIAVVGVLIIFAVGFLIGQVRGTSSSSAQAPANGTTNNGGTTNPGFQRGFGQSHDGRGFGPGGFAGGPHVHGTVKSIDGNTLTITVTADPGGDGANSSKIILTSNTQYLSPMSGTSADKSAIKVGTNIIASGTLSSDGGTMTATRIAILPDGATGPGFSPGFGPPGGPGFGHGDDGGPIGPGASGQVTAINGNTITITPAVSIGGGSSSAVTTIVVSGSPTYVSATGATSSKSAIKSGSLITAQGTLSSDGKTLTATTVRIAAAFGSSSSGSTT
jgi:hypothetical protein